jgi:hypothetical protein
MLDKTGQIWYLIVKKSREKEITKMFNVYYVRSKYALNAHFDEIEEALLFAQNFVNILNGDYVQITNTKTNQIVKIYSK